MKTLRILWRALALFAVLFLAGWIAAVLADRYRFRGRDNAIRQQQNTQTIQHISAGVHSYFEEYGVLPTSLDELLKDQKRGLVWIKWTRDPWGHPVQFALKGNIITMISLGADGKVGGVGVDGDLHCQITLEEHHLVESLSVPTGDAANSQ